MVEQSPHRHTLSKRSRLILKSVLTRERGVKTRHFAIPNVEQVFDLTPDELNAAYRSAAPKLARKALESALAEAGIQPAELDALLVCTCTGYLCPGLTSYIAEAMGIRSNAYLQDLVGLGCGAAIPTLRSASHFLAAVPGATVACIAVEICSAAFYLDDDPGVLISACLFADGAAATVWRSQPGKESMPRCFGFQTLHLPAERDKLRFETRSGKLRNLLHQSVPTLAADAVKRLWMERGPSPVSRIVAHAGGGDVLNALTALFPDYSLAPTGRVMRDFGNMSSPSVLFALEETLKEAVPGPEGDFWLVSFGAGFSAHSCRLGRA
jgi:alkylresorcinol/alkylpyrone synthase